MREGGGYVLSPSLCKTAMTIVRHFQTALEPALALSTGDALLAPDEVELRAGVGLLRTLKPLPVMEGTPIRYKPTVLDPMGSSLPVFPGEEGTYDVHGVAAMRKEEVVKSMGKATSRKADALRKIVEEFDVGDTMLES
jgi:hypothetical protein